MFEGISVGGAPQTKEQSNCIQHARHTSHLLLPLPAVANTPRDKACMSIDPSQSAHMQFALTAKARHQLTHTQQLWQQRAAEQTTGACSSAIILYRQSAQPVRG